MKFTDTLATLQYMGGTVPNHFSMLLYGIYAWSHYWKDLDCNEIRKKLFPHMEEFQIRNYDAILDMIYVHSICIIIFFIGKLLSKKNDYASYLKTTLKVIRITVYFMGFMKVILNNL